LIHDEFAGILNNHSSVVRNDNVWVGRAGFKLRLSGQKEL